MWGKAELLQAIAPMNRGIGATASDRLAIQSLITRLEERNPTPEPFTALDRLGGNWRLLYTTSAELLGIDRLPLYQLGPIYQWIRPDDQRIYNIAEVNGLPGLGGIVSVSARFTAVSRRRVNVAFERGVFGPRGLLGYEQPGQFIDRLDQVAKFPLWRAIDFTINREQSGWLEVTYLDEDMRIGRGNEGNVFVLTRCS